MPSRTFFRSIKEEYPPCIVLLDFKTDYAASSMKAPRRLNFFAPLPTFIVIFQPIHINPQQIIYQNFPEESLYLLVKTP